MNSAARRTDPATVYLTVDEAVQMLRRKGFPRMTAGSLRRRQSRPDPPPCERQAGKVVFRWDRLEAWASQQTRSRIDLQRTALGRWMLNHRHTAVSLSAHLGIALPAMRDLLGHRNAASRRSVQIDVVRLIALETGIGEGVIFEDAARE